MTWLASICRAGGKSTPSSEEKDRIGERVPDVRTTLRAEDSSEKA